MDNKEVEEISGETVEGNTAEDTYEENIEEDAEQKSIPEIKNISVDRVFEIIKNSEDYFILDVRTQEEYDEGHLEGANLIPMQELADRLGELPVDKPIIVHCKSGVRSRSSAELLIENGFNQIYDMGGILDWQEEGYPVITDLVEASKGEEEIKEYAMITVEESFKFLDYIAFFQFLNI